MFRCLSIGLAQLSWRAYAKEVFDRFKEWNQLLVTNKGVIVMKLTVCDSIGLTDPSMLGLSKGWYEFN